MDRLTVFPTDVVAQGGIRRPVAPLIVAVSVPYEGQPEGIYITVLCEAIEMDGLKILAIDETAPVAETIRDRRYPVTFGCFAVYRASDEKGAPGRFAEWIFTRDGAELIEAVGFVPVD